MDLGSISALVDGEQAREKNLDSTVGHDTIMADCSGNKEY